MKKRIFSLVLVLLSLCIFAFTLAGCQILASIHTHIYDEKVATREFIATEATCKDKATYFYSCTCGDKTDETFEYGKFKKCSYSNGVCINCGAIEPPHVHLFNRQVTPDNFIATPASCTSVANYYFSCECGEKSHDTFTYGTVGDCNYINNVCEFCTKRGTNGLIYNLLEDGTYSVSKGKELDTNILVVPLEYNGAIVSSIEKNGFDACKNITTVELNENITSLGAYAFRNCDSLENITLPNKLTSVGNSAFYGCKKIKSIELPNSVVHLGDSAFRFCSLLENITLSANITSIGSYTFADCSALKSLSIPNEVTKISNSAFSNCVALTTLSLPNNIESIGPSAFENCTSLTYNVYSNVKYLGNTNNPYLYLLGTTTKNIYLPSIKNTCKFIGASAFENCTSLLTITIPNSVKKIDASAFAGCTKLYSITLPNGLTEISSLTFKGCSSLKNITLPSGLTTIWDMAFMECTSLKPPTLPDGLTTIGLSAFRKCTALTKIIIPASVTFVNAHAFAEIPKIQLYLRASEVPEEWAYNWYYEGTQSASGVNIFRGYTGN